MFSPPAPNLMNGFFGKEPVFFQNKSKSKKFQ